MKAAKVPRLLRLKFIKGIEEGINEITAEQIENLRPSVPVPEGAVIVGTLPEEFKAFLTLTLILATNRSDAADECVAEEAAGRTPRYEILRVWTDLAETADNLFWTCLRVEMPAPPEFAYEVGVAAAVGPNFEVYYRLLTAEELEEVKPSQSIEKGGEGPRVLH